MADSGSQRGQSDPPPIALEIKLRVRDCYGGEMVHAGTWEIDTAIPDKKGGQTGLTLTTGLTRVDNDGVRAEVEIHRRR